MPELPFPPLPEHPWPVPPGLDALVQGMGDKVNAWLERFGPVGASLLAIAARLDYYEQFIQPAEGRLTVTEQGFAPAMFSQHYDPLLWQLVSDGPMATYRPYSPARPGTPPANAGTTWLPPWLDGTSGTWLASLLQWVNAWLGTFFGLVGQKAPEVSDDRGL